MRVLCCAVVADLLAPRTCSCHLRENSAEKPEKHREIGELRAQKGSQPLVPPGSDQGLSQMGVGARK